MPETAGPGPDDIRNQELRVLAREFLDDANISTYAANLAKVAVLASRLGNVNSLAAFCVLALDIYEGIPVAERPDRIPAVATVAQLKRYLSATSSAVKRIWNPPRQRRNATQPLTGIGDIAGMLESGSPFLVAAGLLLRHRRGRIWYDTFLNKIRTDWGCGLDETVVAAFDVGDEAMRNIMAWMIIKDVDTLGHIAFSKVIEAVSFVAYLDKRDVLLEHVRGVALWDGTERLKDLLTLGFGCAVDDSIGQTQEYLTAVGRNFLISLIARSQRPGVKADAMPIFMGAQGTFKSTAMKIIGGPFHREISEPTATKDFYLQIQGCWVGEIAEMASIVSNKSELTKTKAMLSRDEDVFRPPYGHGMQVFPRRLIFAGTSNPMAVGVLRDESGERRSDPVICGVIDLEWLRTHREQLIAEALREYENGATWWEVPQDAHRLAVEHQRSTSVHEPLISEMLLRSDLYDGTATGPGLIKPDITAAEPGLRWGNVVQVNRVCMQWLGLTASEAFRAEAQVAAILIRLGWKRRQESVRLLQGSRKVWCWVVEDSTTRELLRHHNELNDPPPGDDIPF
jgi:putative DNA primase/helicase